MACDEKRWKGTKVCVVSEDLTFDDYKAFLFDGRTVYREQTLFENKKVLMLQFLLIQFYTVYEKYVIHYIMHVLIWNSSGKYTFCLATRVVCTQVLAEQGPLRQED